VDHGKTTLSDCLISSNGIISHKLAGRVRYLDSTEDEQARGITMKSSAIALLHTDDAFRELRRKAAVTASDGGGGGASTTPVPYLVNLIDSPGHVDFSMDVATAARLCDGALVVVDAVEGICIQTHAVLKVAWAEGVRPTLVVNKLDRLITELQLTPLEAYHHITRIIEQANVIMSELYTAELMSNLTGGSGGGSGGVGGGGEGSSGSGAAPAAAAAAAAADGGDGAEAELVVAEADEVDGSSSSGGAGRSGGGKVTFDAWGIDIDEATEARLFFDPARGNVVFASAFDGWAFSVDDFAGRNAEKLGVSRAVLRRALWGEYYYKPKVCVRRCNCIHHSPTHPHHPPITRRARRS